MSKKRNEPIEGIEPTLNGLDFTLPLPSENGYASPDEELWQQEEEAQEEDFAPDPVALIIGDDAVAQATATLARQCGFALEFALPQSDSTNSMPGFAEALHALENFENLVADCNIGRHTFVCIFMDNPQECETILTQCLDSEAYYIGLAARGQEKDEIFARLKENGAPDAELAAIAAPMGLRIGAVSPEQRAVAIVAEMLAARAGKLKKLHH